MNETHNKNALDHWIKYGSEHGLELQPARGSGGADVLRGTCPECRKEKKFDVFTNMPMTGTCIACGYKVDNVFKIGYNSGEKKKEQSPVERAVWAYRKNNPEKAYRLTNELAIKLGLQVRTLWSSNKNKEFDALCFIGTDDRPVKWLLTSKDSKWLAVEDKDKYGNKLRSSDYWINLPNVLKQGIMKGTEHENRLYICAGEPDLTSFLVNVGVHTLSPVFGEGPKLNVDPENFDICDNKHNVTILDNDKIGRKGGKWIAPAIYYSQKVKSNKVVDLSELGLSGGQDTDDFFKGGGTSKRLLQQINDTPDFKHEQMGVGEVFSIQERSVKRSENINSILTDELQDMIWKIGILPESRRKKLWNELLVFENIDLENEENKEYIKNRTKTYNEEFQTLTFLAYDNLIRDKVSDLFVRKMRKYQLMESSKYYYYERGVYRFMDEENMQMIADEIARSLTSPDNRLSLAKSRKQALEDLNHKLTEAIETTFDKDKSYINFINGIYDLDTSKLLEHNSKYLSTSQLDIEYKEGGECPNFQKALDMWFEFEDTKREFVKSLYYLVTGDRSHDKALFFFGKGSNGKGQASHLCQALIGEHLTSAIGIEEINHNHMTAGLLGKRLNISDESSARHHINDAIFKRLTGNSVITINPKNKDPITFISQALWLIISNSLPSSSDNSHGYDRRWKLINFKKVTEKEKITGFFENMLKPELSSIMHYVLTTGREYWEKDGGFIDSELEKKTKSEMEDKHSANSYWKNIYTEYSDAVDEKVKSGPNINAGDAAKSMIVKYKTSFTAIEPYYIFELREDRDKKEHICVDTRRHFVAYKKATEDSNQAPLSEHKFRDSTENFLEKTFEILCNKGFDTISSRDKNNKNKVEKILKVRT